MKLVSVAEGLLIHPDNVVETACLHSGLPKWPAMRVAGTPVTVDQAKEIIRRTDSAFTHGLYGNDRDHLRMVATKLKMPRSVGDDDVSGLPFTDFYAARERWFSTWGIIDLHYIENHWVSSSYVYGPHGWCHPDGMISHFKNVGKWPSAEDLAQDWLLVSQAFPFLDLSATFFDREYCEQDPVAVFTIRIRDGGATIHPGEKNSLFCDLPTENEVFNTGSECGIPLSWFDDWSSHAPK